MTQDEVSSSAMLLEQAQAGDLEALEALLRTVQPQLYRFSMKMCRHPQDAEDVLQDSLLSVARSIGDYRGGASLSTWLFTIARSFCIKKRRKSKFAPSREESLEGLPPAEREQLRSPSRDPQQVVEAAETWQQVQEGIRRMEPAYREVLVLRDVEGLSAKEVSEVVGISVSAVKSRLHRARKELRDRLRKAPYRPRKGCPDIRDVFSRHLENELSPQICASMEVHVESCSDCAAECAGLKEVLRACSTAECEVPPEIQGQIQVAMREALGRAGH